MRPGIVMAMVALLLAPAGLRAQSPRPVPSSSDWKPRNYPELRALMEGGGDVFAPPLMAQPQRIPLDPPARPLSPPADGFVPSRAVTPVSGEFGVPRLPPLPSPPGGVQNASSEYYAPGVVPPADVSGWTPAHPPQPGAPPALIAPPRTTSSAPLTPPPAAPRANASPVARDQLFDTAWNDPSTGYNPAPTQPYSSPASGQQNYGDHVHNWDSAPQQYGSDLFCDTDGCDDFVYQPIDCDCHHHGRFLPFVFFGPRFGDDRNLSRLGIAVPIRQRRPDSLLFLDFRGDIDHDSGGEGNFGLVYKTYLNPNWIFGSYIYYDLLASSHGNTFNQMTIGMELLSVDWDFRVNGHLPASGSKGANVANGVSHATIITRDFRERAYSGVDAELGRRILHWGWNDGWQVYWFVGGYAFEHDAEGFESFGGPRTRIEVRISDLEWMGEQSRLEIGVEGSYDRVRDGQAGAFLRCRVPLWRMAKRPRLDTLRRRMVDLPMRDID